MQKRKLVIGLSRALVLGALLSCSAPPTWPRLRRSAPASGAGRSHWGTACSGPCLCARILALAGERLRLDSGPLGRRGAGVPRMGPWQLASRAAGVVLRGWALAVAPP